MIKEFTFLETKLISLSERKARTIKFDPKRTIILGDNSKGKSSLLKSVMRTFGCDPTVVPTKWERADVASLVKFSVKSDVYYAVKNGKSYSIFDESLKSLGTFKGITKGYHEFLAELFDFKLILSDKNNNVVTPPPSCYFLPYYIDQDISWQNSWSTFKGLKQFRNVKETLARYHTGIRPNQYYETKIEIDQLKEELKENDQKISLLKGILNNLKEKLENAKFDIDLTTFQNEIEDLLLECESLNEVENDLKDKLNTLYNLKISLETQIKITQKALSELQKDYKYAVEALEDEVECPTCGIVHTNSFAERFAVAQDEQRCFELLNELRFELGETNETISKEREKFLETEKELARLQEILQRKQGDIELKDVIESEGKKEVKSLFSIELDQYQELRFKQTMLLGQLDDKLKNLENPEKRKSIMGFFKSEMRRALNSLDLQSLPDSTFNKIDFKIKETGSRRPRVFISYYLTILKVIMKHGSSVFAPIIIDSPNQQDQDEENFRRIIHFIDENQPSGSQLILALTSLHNLDINGEIINLENEKESFLLEEEYDEVFDFMRPLLDQGYEDQGRLFF